MTKEDLILGNKLDMQIKHIAEAEEALDKEGVAIAIAALNQRGDTLIIPEKFREALGETGYNALMATFIGDLSSALAAAKVTAQNAFDMLGE